MQSQVGQMDKVCCRPDIDIATLKTLIKEKFQPKLDKWAPADLTLKFNGIILEPDDLVAVIAAELRNASGKRVAVKVETS